MKIKILFFLCIIVLSAILLLRMNPFKPANPPWPGVLNMTRELQIIGWIPFWDQDNAFSSFKQHAEAFDYISVFWFKIDEEGRLEAYDESKIDTELISYAQSKGVKVIALIANLSEDGQDNWDYRRADKVINTADTRSQHIQAIIELAETYNFDGIDIDYENLKAYQRENFSLFIEELADSLHQNNKLLGVAIHPKTGEFKPEEDYGAHAQDTARISAAADHLYYMTYLQHTIHSPSPGPPGSIQWIQKIMNYAVDFNKVPKEKIFMGIGLFGVSWKENEDGSFSGEHSDLSFSYISDEVSKYGIEPVWDNSSSTPSVTITDENGIHIIWFENAYSIRQKITLARELGVGGLAFWRLGGEDQAVWNLLK
jgi:spore germination protein